MSTEELMGQLALVSWVWLLLGVITGCGVGCWMRDQRGPRE